MRIDSHIEQSLTSSEGSGGSAASPTVISRVLKLSVRWTYILSFKGLHRVTQTRMDQRHQLLLFRMSTAPSHGQYRHSVHRQILANRMAAWQGYG